MTAFCIHSFFELGLYNASAILMRRMPQPFDSSDIPVVTHHQQGDYMTTDCHTNQMVTPYIQCQCRIVTIQHPLELFSGKATDAQNP